MFIVKRVVNPLSYSFETFATDWITAFQIMPIFWKAAAYLERISLEVIATTADGASQNKNLLECLNIFHEVEMLMLFIAHKKFIQKKCALFTIFQMPLIW